MRSPKIPRIELTTYSSLDQLKIWFEEQDCYFYPRKRLRESRYGPPRSFYMIDDPYNNISIYYNNSNIDSKKIVTVDTQYSNNPELVTMFAMLFSA